MNIVKANAIDSKITHFHEALMTTSKIFFDLDIKIPEAAVSSRAVNKFCQTQLGDIQSDE